MAMTIHIQKLRKQFGEVVAVDDADLRIEGCDRIAILGSSGSGKSTLLLMLAGLVVPDGGSILCDGKILDSAPDKRDIAMAFQEPSLWNHMNVRENMLFGCPIKGKGERKRYIEELARDLEIEDLLERYPHQISGGQARRVAIGRALACQRSLLLLDEAFSNLDETTATKTMEVVRKRCEGRSAMVLVTHIPAQAKWFDARIYSLDKGRLMEGALED